MVFVKKVTPKVGKLKKSSKIETNLLVQVQKTQKKHKKHVPNLKGKNRNKISKISKIV